MMEPSAARTGQDRRSGALGSMLLRLLVGRLFVPTLILILLILSLTSFMWARSLGGQQMELASMLANNIGSFLQNAEKMLRSAADVADQHNERELAFYLKFCRQGFGYFDAIYRLDPDGIVVKPEPHDPRYVGLDQSRQPFLLEPATKVGFFISRPFRSLRTGKPTVNMTWPLSDGGLLVAELNLGTFQEAVKAARHEPGHSTITIVDQADTLLAHPRAELIAQQAQIVNRPILHQGRKGKATQHYRTDSQWMLGSCTLINATGRDTGWVVLVEAPLAAVYGPLLKVALPFIFLCLGVWLLVVTTFKKRFWRHVVAPLADLAQTAEAISSGDLERTAKVQTDDEIGVLARAFNRMTTQLSLLIRSLEKEIRERRQVEQSLQESEDRYRSLFDDSPISLWEQDFSRVKEYFDTLRASDVQDFRSHFENNPAAVEQCVGLVRVLDINKATLDLLGARDKAELLGGLSTVFAEDSLVVFREELIALAQGKLQFGSEACQRSLTGEEKRVALQLRVAPGYEESLGKVLVSLFDLTEQRQAKQKLEEINDALVQERNIFIRGSAVVFKWRNQPGWPVEYVSPNVEGVFGYTSEEFLSGKISYADILVPEEMERFAHEISTSGTNRVESFVHLPYRIVRKDGKIVWLADYRTIVRDRNGEITHFLGYVLDITERKLVEEALRKAHDDLEDLVRQRTAQLAAAKEQAEAANAAKSDFLARMSHEIRTPLNAITGLTRIVLKSNLTGEQRDYLNKVQIASRNLLVVINDILDFSKVEAGRLEFTNTPFDLDQMIEQLADLFCNRVVQKDLELIFAVAPQVARHLVGDAGRLTQVMTNLIENAVKFTECGEIVVRVEQADGAATRPGAATLRFSVRDTGIGIGPEVIPTLFQPFSQVGSYLTRKHEGTGLGLAICRRLVELMGGTIEVQSAAGLGSTFAFTVSLEVQKTEKPARRPPLELCGLKSLVVDDSATARQVLSDLLHSFKFKVSAAETGEAALDELRRSAPAEPYQLVLLDWKMPGLDGVETARRIRALAQDDSGAALSGARPQATVPIIILVTAYGHELVQARMDTSAADSLLLKPVKPSELFNTIMGLFGRAEAVSSSVQRTRTAPLGSLAGRRVLVVEDSELNRDLAVVLLEEAGLAVETAVTGKAAVDKISALPIGYFDAVLMDIQMPVMDGYEAARQIRRREGRNPQKRLPIIALTAHALTGEKEKCLAAGMDDYLAKPIDEKDLYQVLQNWISAAQATAIGASKALQAEQQSVPVPVLDVQSALRRMGGRSAIYSKAIRKFAPEFGQTDSAIRRNLAAGDRDSAKLSAHSTKGAAATIGAVGLSQSAGKLEQAIAAGDSDIDNLLDLFERDLKMTLDAVEGFLKHDRETV